MTSIVLIRYMLNKWVRPSNEQKTIPTIAKKTNQFQSVYLLYKKSKSRNLGKSKVGTGNFLTFCLGVNTIISDFVKLNAPSVPMCIQSAFNPLRLKKRQSVTNIQKCIVYKGISFYTFSHSTINLQRGSHLIIVYFSEYFLR